MTELTPETQLREYQKDILEFAKTHNTLCILQTGMGKTLIAYDLVAYMKKCDLDAGYKPRISFFLTPTCNLTSQQSEYAIKRLPNISIIQFVLEHDYYRSLMP